MILSMVSVFTVKILFSQKRQHILLQRLRSFIVIY